MNYNDFLNIINEENFNKIIYDNMIKKYGFSLISKYFSKYMESNNLPEDSYDKCKFFLEDELKNADKDYESTGDLDILKLYLEEIGQFQLLEPVEERKILVRLDSLKKSINNYNEKYNINDMISMYGNDFDKLTNINDKSIKILRDYLIKEKEYKALTNELIECNLRLVLLVAKRYSNATNEILDLIQEGNIGIKIAVEKFDIEKGNKFSTYAMWWIRQQIVRSIFLNSRTIKLPVNKHELLYKIKRATNLYEKEYNKLPSSKELIDFINRKVKEGVLKESKSYDNLTPEVIDDLKKITQNIVSINAKVGEDESSSLEEFIVNEEQESVEDIVVKNMLVEDIKGMFEEINSRFKLVIILRFGFALEKYMNYEEFLTCFNELNYSEVYYKKLYENLCKFTRVYTLEQIAEIYGLTRERIRQMEAKTLRVIRNKNKKMKILQHDFLDLYK